MSASPETAAGYLCAAADAQRATLPSTHGPETIFDELFSKLDQEKQFSLSSPQPDPNDQPGDEVKGEFTHTYADEAPTASLPTINEELHAKHYGVQPNKTYWTLDKRSIVVLPSDVVTSALTTHSGQLDRASHDGAGEQSLVTHSLPSPGPSTLPGLPIIRDERVMTGTLQRLLPIPLPRGKEDVFAADDTATESLPVYVAIDEALPEVAAALLPDQEAKAPVIFPLLSGVEAADLYGYGVEESLG